MKKNGLLFSPIKHMVKIFFVCLVMLLVTGCSIFSKEDTGPEPTPLSPVRSSKVSLSELWSQKAGNGQGNVWLSLRPAIMGDSIYTASYSGLVSAFDLNDGKVIWTKKLDMPVTGGVAAHDGLIAVGTTSGQVIALDADSGRIKWSAEATGEILSAPAIDDDTVVAQSINGKVTAFNAESGERLWQQSAIPPVLLLRGSASPVIFQGRVYTGFANGDVVAWNEETGQQLWQANIALPEGMSELSRMVDVDATPLVTGSRMYAVSYQGNLKAIDITNGQILWSRKASSYQRPALTSGSLYIAAANSYLHAIDSSSGATLWTQKALAYRQLSSPQVYTNYVLAGDYEGYLHVISQADGSIVGRYHVASSGIRVQPVVIGNRVYVFTDDGRLIALEIKEK